MPAPPRRVGIALGTTVIGLALMASLISESAIARAAGGSGQAPLTSDRAALKLADGERPPKWGVYAIVDNELAKLTRPEFEWEGGYPGERAAIDNQGQFNSIPVGIPPNERQQSLRDRSRFIIYGPYSDPAIFPTVAGAGWQHRIARQSPLPLLVSPVVGERDMYVIEVKRRMRVSRGPDPPDVYVFSVKGCKDNTFDGKCNFPIGIVQ